MELACLAIDSGGDPAVIQAALDPTPLPVSCRTSNLLTNDLSDQDAELRCPMNLLSLHLSCKEHWSEFILVSRCLMWRA